MSPPASRPVDLAAALPRLPLFPLPQTVLFPGALLPLHIFEPRYKAMVRDAITSHRLIAVVLITDAAALDAYSHPSIASVAGVGEIIEHADLPGGRYNILLQGHARVRLKELPFTPPYRCAQATVIDDLPGEVPQGAHTALLSAAASFAKLVRDRDRSFDFDVPRGANAALAANLCAHHLVLDPHERQAILETPDVSERVLRVTEALALQRHALTADIRSLN